MKNVIYISIVSFCLIILLISINAQAELIDRGGGLIYDTTLNITWLQDANYANTSEYQPVNRPFNGGLMDWYDTRIWINSLNGSNFMGYSDWRLPDTIPFHGSPAPYGVDNEMGHLFYYDLGGIAPITDSTPFINLQDVYWTGLEHAHVSHDTVYSFYFNTGGQYTNSKNTQLYAWLVRDGDSTPPLIPEPMNSILFVAGGALLSARKYFKKRQ